MYEYKKQSVDHENFRNNIKKETYSNHLLKTRHVQNICFPKDIRGVISRKTIQRIGEEHLVAYDEDVLAVKRGNVRSDIVDTHGKSYFLVQEIPNILDDIFEKLCAVVNDREMCDEANIILEDIMELKPFIHALVVKYLKVGNCLDFSKLVFTKLVEKNYGKWIYECYLEKSVPQNIEDDEWIINIKYKDKAEKQFDILNPATYADAKVKYKGKDIPLRDYLDGENPTGYPLKMMNTAILLKREESMGMIEMKYIMPVIKTKLRQAYDHAFVITYPDEVNTASEMNIRWAMVVDSWGGLSPRTLQAFLNYGNPYKDDLDTKDIKIRNKKQSTGNPFHFPNVEKMIQHIVDQHIMNIREDSPEVQQVYQDAVEGRNIDRVYG